MSAKSSEKDQLIVELKNELSRKQLEMHSIKEIGKALSSELRTSRLMLLIMDQVTRLMNGERSSFYIVDEERGELWTQIAQKAEVKEIRLKIGKGIAGHVAKTGEVINIADAYNDPRFDPSIDKKTGYRTKSILCMPIFEPLKNGNRESRIIGVLQILNKQDGVFSHDDEELLSSLASQVAISLINARLFTALEQKVGELNLLFEIEQELNKAYNLDELLNLLVEKISQALKVEAVLISIKDQSNMGYSRRAAKNLDLGELETFILSPEKGIIGEVMRTGEIYLTNDAPNDPLFKEHMGQISGLNIKQIICVPLKAGNQVLGFIEVFNKPEKSEIFREDDRSLIRSLASQISRSIDTFRLREEKMKAERLVSIGNMMSTIVHDLRTPMNNIYGFVDLMQDEEEAAVRSDYADIIINQIKTLNNMTSDVLDFAKGKTSILPIKYAVDRVLDNFSKIFEADIRKQGFEYKAVCNAQSMIYADPDKLNRIFMNIMRNALEAMEPGGTFSITANQLENEIEFLLSDTGKGIPEEIREHLFDSFVTSGKESGTGLGLAIVKKLIDEHNGRIEVDSAPNQGTTFKIYFKRL